MTQAPHASHSPRHPCWRCYRGARRNLGINPIWALIIAMFGWDDRSKRRAEAYKRAMAEWVKQNPPEQEVGRERAMTEIGDRIRLVRLDSPTGQVPPGTEGTVTGENVIRGRDLAGKPTETITGFYVLWDIGPYGLANRLTPGDDEWESA